MFRPQLLAMLILGALQTSCVIELGPNNRDIGEPQDVITDNQKCEENEDSVKENKSTKLVMAASLALALNGCTSGDSGEGITVSGNLFTTANVMIDSDINDISAIYQSNNDPSAPQALPNIVTVQGFASATPTGAPESGDASFERFADTIDNEDYFSVSLQAGQKVVLEVVDYSGNRNGSAFSGDLDLYLFNTSLSTSEYIDASFTETDREEVTATVDGEYLVNVSAYSGISKYVLKILPPETSILNQTAEPSISSGFVTGEAIIRWKETLSTGAFSAASTGVQANGYRVQTDSSRTDTPVKASLHAPVSAQAGSVQSEMSPLAKLNPAWDKARETLLTIKALNARDDVEYAEPNFIRHALLTPNDPLYAQQYHYKSIKLPQAWDLTSGSSDVIVAVIDSGAFVDHPDLDGKLAFGYDFISDTSISRDGDGIDSNPDDPGDSPQRGASSWHGTHVTGTVSAITGNNRGGAGAGGLTRVMPLRVLGLNGEGSSYDVIQAVRYAAGLSNDSNTTPSQRADIINLSLGAASSSNAEQEVITAARDAGVIIVAAAGNSNSASPFYPASYNGVVSVSATAPDNTRAYYSNYGSRIDVAAPGGDLRFDTNGDGQNDGVISTSVDDSSGSRQESYALQQGTSMATPHVAAVAALMKAVHPTMTPAQFDNLLSAGDITDDIGDSGRDNDFGHGLINAYKAVQAADNLAGGGSITPVAVLESTPSELILGTNSSMSLTLDNINNNATDPEVTAEVSEDWMSLDNSQTDSNGLGTYTLTVSRTDLLDGLYEGLIRFSPDTGNSLDVRVAIQVGDVVGAIDTSPQYVLLTDAESGEVVAETLANSDGSYTVTKVPVGSYRVIGGSDIDVDLFVCQNGETCGGYPNNISEEVIEVTESVGGIDFVVSLVSGVGASSASIQRLAPEPEISPDDSSLETGEDSSGKKVGKEAY